MPTYKFTIDKDTIRNNGTYEINLWECYDDDGSEAIIQSIDEMTIKGLIDLQNVLNTFIENKIL